MPLTAAGNFPEINRNANGKCLKATFLKSGKIEHN